MTEVVGSPDVSSGLPVAQFSEKMPCRRWPNAFYLRAPDLLEHRTEHMGISNEISEIALNPKLKVMEGIYDVREEISERRRAMEVWANFIAECSKDQEPEIAQQTNALQFRKAS